MPRYTVNGIQLYCEVKGRGNPLLFICGFSSRHQGWNCFANAFSLRRQTIVFDHRGSGQSSTTPPPYTIELLARDVIALLDVLGTDQVDLISSSMGSAIALTLALNYPERIGKGVLIAPFAKLPKASLMKLQAIGKLLKSNAPFDQIVESALPWLFSNHSLIKEELITAKREDLLDPSYRQPLAGYLGQLAALEAFDMRAVISKIKTPLLLIAGQEDRATPLYCAKLLADQLPQASLLTIPAAGHMVHVEQRAQVMSKAATFLSSKTG